MGMLTHERPYRTLSGYWGAKPSCPSKADSTAYLLECIRTVTTSSGSGENTS